jgi:thiamine-phosphate pyrophosphorylase
MAHNLHGLYAITDASLIAEKKFSAAIEQALAGGARIIQYRDKSKNIKKRLRQVASIKLLCEKYSGVFIINDDIDLAKAIDADGVHIGANDACYATAREKLGDSKVIGVSCYNQLEYALQAQKKGADYVAFGRFFASSVKPNAAAANAGLLTQAKGKLTVPICAIGGITLNNAAQLITAGADMLAVITAVFAAKDIKTTCQKFNILFENFSARQKIQGHSA